MATEGEMVKVVGMAVYDGCIGRVVGRTGAGLVRVQMEVDGKIVGADSNQFRVLTGEEKKGLSRKKKKMTPIEELLEEFGRRANWSSGREREVWEEAKKLLSSMKKT